MVAWQRSAMAGVVALAAQVGVCGRRFERRHWWIPTPVLCQQLPGMGTALAWGGNVVGGWSDPNRTAIADLLFSPGQRLGAEHRPLPRWRWTESGVAGNRLRGPASRLAAACLSTKPWRLGLDG